MTANLHQISASGKMADFYHFWSDAKIVIFASSTQRHKNYPWGVTTSAGHLLQYEGEAAFSDTTTACGSQNQETYNGC
jgi:hypothetical protein